MGGELNCICGAGLKGWEKRLIISDRAHIGKFHQVHHLFFFFYVCVNVWMNTRKKKRNVYASSPAFSEVCESVCPLSPSSAVFDFHQAVDGVQEQQRQEQAGKK